MVNLFWECPFLPLQHVRELPEFAYLMSLDRSKWPRCFGCLVLVTLVIGISGLPLLVTWLPLERCLSAYPVDFAAAEYWDAADIALEMTEHPNIWTDGSREDFSSIGGFEVAGAGV